MQPAPRRWRVSDAEPLPGLHPVVGQVLAARGFDASGASAFLDASGGYHDPFGLPAMEAAVEAIAGAAALRLRDASRNANRVHRGR